MPVTTAHAALPEVSRAGHFVRFHLAGFEQHLVKPVDRDRVDDVVGLPASVLDGATM